jgi:hypothetical protein
MTANEFDADQDIVGLLFTCGKGQIQDTTGCHQSISRTGFAVIQDGCAGKFASGFEAHERRPQL